MPDPELAADVLSGGGRGLSHAEHVMGTVVSFDVRDPDVPASAIDRAVEYLHDIDRRFSPWKADSEISRLMRGELALDDASADVRWIMGQCDELARVTDGYFDARRHRADGLADPTGVVKGWAVEEAAFLLLDAGARNFVINGGGDILTRGSPQPGSDERWQIGIQHPIERDRLATVLGVEDAAIATSGTYERGLHVIDPHTGVPAAELVSITIVGSSLTYADAYATAAFAMGRKGVEWLARRGDYEAFAITADSYAIWTPGLDRVRVS